MRLHRRKRGPPAGDAEQAISQAEAARAEAAERLASAAEIRAGAARQADWEQRTIVVELRAMRERNHLAELILDSVVKRGQS